MEIAQLKLTLDLANAKLAREMRKSMRSGKGPSQAQRDAYREAMTAYLNFSLPSTALQSCPKRANHYWGGFSFNWRASKGCAFFTSLSYSALSMAIPCH